MSESRTYDVVVFGATGFTGALIAEYLAAHGGPSLRWAIAGRDRERLEALAERLRKRAPTKAEIGLVVADRNSAPSLQKMALSTRVLLTTVGPYVEHGAKVVHACCVGGADYVDITGEPEFVDEIWDTYDDMARDRGVRIVPCCGFDSIPHDLGVLRTVSRLPSDQPIDVEGFVRAQGAPSGGTWQSAIRAMARYREFRRDQAARRANRGPRDGERTVGSLPDRVRYDREAGGWVFPLPTVDPMIVRRSARALDVYGPAFRYGHYGVTRSLPKLAAGAVAIGGLFALAQFGPTREFLLSRRASGDGPSANARARSWFEATFVGRSGPNRVVTRIHGGDPGYDETARMAAEAALCLAFDRDRLPERAGVLTPAIAMGEILIERLGAAGLPFEIISEI